MSIARIMEFKDIQALIADDMDAVNTLIQDSLKSDVVLINQLNHYIINNGLS